MPDLPTVFAVDELQRLLKRRYVQLIAGTLLEKLQAQVLVVKAKSV